MDLFAFFTRPFFFQPACRDRLASASPSSWESSKASTSSSTPYRASSFPAVLLLPPHENDPWAATAPPARRPTDNSAAKETVLNVRNNSNTLRPLMSSLPCAAHRLGLRLLPM